MYTRGQIAAPKLDRRVELQAFSVSRDEAGQPLKCWQAYATVWARVFEARADEKFTAEQTIATVTKEFTIRYRTDIAVKHRVVFEEKSYDIKSISSLGRRKWLKVIAKARAE
ncbi:MAG: phage head closure protein [Candidatus Eisenbacteria sp.]|nr:phage head closure protein [Candidatus Eisenbacteria bacterium]